MTCECSQCQLAEAIDHAVDQVIERFAECTVCVDGEFTSALLPSPDGEWVRYADHAALQVDRDDWLQVSRDWRIRAEAAEQRTESQRSYAQSLSARYELQGQALDQARAAHEATKAAASEALDSREARIRAAEQRVAELGILLNNATRLASDEGDARRALEQRGAELKAALHSSRSLLVDAYSDSDIRLNTEWVEQYRDWLRANAR